MTADPHDHHDHDHDHHDHDHGHSHAHDHHGHSAHPTVAAQNPYQHPVLAAVLNEALALLGDGVPAAAIEEASVTLGMPQGALAALDAVSLEVVDHALHAALDAHGHGHSHGHDHDHSHDHSHDHRHQHHPAHSHDHSHHHGHHHDHEHDHDHAHHAHTAPAPALTESAVYVMEKMAHGFKRLGKAAQRGFYDYSDEPAQLWSGLKTFERRRKDIEPTDILDRLRLAAVLASFNQGTPASDSVRMHLGTDLPSDSDQARAWLARAGQPGLQARSAQLSERYGARFTWPQANPSEHA